jgi:hypothetical protein
MASGSNRCITPMSEAIPIFGGTGFLGRRIV